MQKAQLVKYMSKRQLFNFDKIDVDGTGRVTYQEWEQWIVDNDQGSGRVFSLKPRFIWAHQSCTTCDKLSFKDDEESIRNDAKDYWNEKLATKLPEGEVEYFSIL